MTFRTPCILNFVEPVKYGVARTCVIIPRSRTDITREIFISCGIAWTAVNFCDQCKYVCKYIFPKIERTFMHFEPPVPWDRTFVTVHYEKHPRLHTEPIISWRKTLFRKRPISFNDPPRFNKITITKIIPFVTRITIQAHKNSHAQSTIPNLLRRIHQAPRNQKSTHQAPLFFSFTIRRVIKFTRKRSTQQIRLFRSSTQNNRSSDPLPFFSIF